MEQETMGAGLNPPLLRITYKVPWKCIHVIYNYYYGIIKRLLYPAVYQVLIYQVQRE